MSIKVPISAFTEQVRKDCTVKGKYNPYGPSPIAYAFATTLNSAFLPLAYYLNKHKHVQAPQPQPLSSVTHSWRFYSEKYPFRTDGGRDQEVVFNEATMLLKKHHSVLLSLYCAFGKTFLAIRLASIFSSIERQQATLSADVSVGRRLVEPSCPRPHRVRCAVLVHRDVLKEQWLESITKFSNARAVIVDNTSPIDPDSADIFIFNIAMVPKQWNKQEKRWEPKKLGVFKWIDLLIVDEAHIACAEEMAKALYYFTPKWSIALTATPRRPDGMDGMLELYFGKYTQTQIVRIATNKFEIHCIETDVTPPFKLSAAGRKDWNAVLEELMNNEERNNLILRLVEEHLVPPENTILIFAKRVAHCKALAAQIPGSTIMVSSQKTYDKTARVLLSTFSKLGVGFDDGRINILILAAPIATQLEQYAGRLRDQPGKRRIVIDLVDNDSNCKKQWKTRKTWYESRNGEIKYIAANAQAEPDPEPAEQEQAPAQRRLAKKA